MLKEIPELRGGDALEALLNFYEDLGWNRNEPLKPTRVVMSEDEWLELLEQLIQIEGDDHRLDIGGEKNENKITKYRDLVCCGCSFTFSHSQCRCH